MRKLFFIYFLLAFQFTVFAQSRTHLPYSVFGIGELFPKGSVRNMAMGKTGIALSSGRYLNSLNPASYHTIDSISFFFDFGLNGKIVKYRTTYDKAQNGNDVNLSNIALGFRISRNWASSVGISPYSTVGYKIETLKSVDGAEDNMLAVMTGNGGLNQLYWNNSYMLFKRLSLGVNFTYLFGNIKSTETVSYHQFAYDIVSEQTSYLNKIYADFGVQYFFPVKKNFEVMLGGIFGNSHKLNFKHRITLSNTVGTISEDEITERGTFDFPMYFGGGIGMYFKNKLTISADYLYHDWSGTSSDNADFKYRNANTFRLGAEYIPGMFNKLGYFGTISYRAGLYYEESYLEVRKSDIADHGFTFGLGLPFMQNKTSINLSYNMGFNGTLDNGLIKENYHSFMVNLTLHDWWFIKRKFD